MIDALLITQSVLLLAFLVLMFPIGFKEWQTRWAYWQYLRWVRSMTPKKQSSP